ncbi:hypothetical protein WJX82_010541 [Trebouxia sp. C0006]
MSDRSDTHWSSTVPPKKTKDLSKEALGAYKTARLYSCYVKATDGVKLAVDVMLPKDKPSNAPLPCVLFQARYTRGVQLRFPFRLMTDGRPYDFINIGFKAEALLKGYAVISMDFRGTGASFGQWRLPWGAVERHDSLAVLDWMTGQPWCNGKVVLCGQSYDATAALFTTSMQHPAVKGCVALYPFWDLYHDIAIPGGIAMKSFSEAWALFCKGMDYNDYSVLQSPAKQLLSTVSKGCNPVINYNGARCTARSFADMTKGTRLLLHRLTHPTKMLTLGSNQAMLASHAAPSRRSIQGTAPAAPSAAGTAGTPEQQTGSSGGAEPSPPAPPTPQPAAITGTSQQASTSGMERQLSLDTAKDQHSYRSWNRAGIQHQGVGPMVNAQTIPARGANTEGVSASWLHISVRRHYKEKGKRLLAAAVAEHDTWDSAAAMKTIRFTDQQASQTKATTSDASLCSRGDELRQANVPLQLVSGWLDSTAAAAINLYHYCGQAPGSELVLGPWSHGGLVDQSVGKDSSFDQPKHSMAFINRFRHDISLDKHPKGLSRYDAISKITKSMHYDNLGKCGHLVFTGPPLQAATQVVGSVGVEVWVESSGQELDLFAYLEDVDTDGNVSYVTEGMFRVSHRKEYPTPPIGDLRAKASLPGEPFHSFSQKDAEETPAGAAVLCRFQMMPTAYCFAQGHSMRVAFSGGDAKHFYVDHLGIKTMWVHTGPGRQSAIHIYVTNQ